MSRDALVAMGPYGFVLAIVQLIVLIDEGVEPAILPRRPSSPSPKT
jgi:hypothetical protein